MRHSALDAVVPRLRQKILAAVFMDPDKAWYRSALARRLGVGPSSLQRPLESLAKAGIVTARQDGNRIYFQANLDSPLAAELRGLVRKTHGLLDVLKDALEPAAAQIAFSFVFGSLARDKARSESDIDLMVVGKARPSALTSALTDAEMQLSRPINTVVYTPDEFRRRALAGKHFLKQVLEREKLFVLGTIGDVERAAGIRSSGKAQDKQRRAR